MIFRFGHVAGLALSLIPFSIISLIVLWNRPFWSFILLFVGNYLVSGASRYLGYSSGIAMDAIFLLVIIVTIPQFFRRENPLTLKDSSHPLTAISLIWLIYCGFEAFNPGSSSYLAWLINVRGMALYFFVVVVLTSVYLKKFDDMKRILRILSVLSVVAVLKAIGQKTFGFDPFEQLWLDEGGANTHIIHTGIRYFSIFTDAGNFGSGIAFAGSLFLILSFGLEKRSEKLYYLAVSAFSFYGMVISGTRGSLVIPFAALVLYVFLSKSLRGILLSIIGIGIAFWFLNFTYIGHGNTYIRRMRSAFNPDDASLSVRIENQKILRIYMAGKPFGYGLGMKRGSAQFYVPHPVLSKIAHDSWYMLLWAELGLVGMILYILILLSIIFYGSYLVIVVLKNRELRIITAAIVCALFGVSAAAYSLEIFGQLPNSIIIFTSMTIIFLSPKFDKELLQLQNERL